MRFPDAVEILKPSGVDGYGNPGRSFVDPQVVQVSGFEVRRDTLLLLPATSGIEEGDRVRLRGKTFAATPTEIRSPSRTVLFTVELEEVEGL
jgi:hypothetical protein